VKILMMTNTFPPFVGGVSRSVTSFSRELRTMGHRVMIVAPEFERVPKSEKDVIRIPAIQHFNGSDFAVALPIPGLLSAQLHHFKPDLVHSHHPHLLGGTALRAAGRFDCPLVFTYHTMYEHYVHYVPAHAKRFRKFVIELVSGYCNLCDRVVAPSGSVAELLRERDVETAIDVVPTGVYTEQFGRGDGGRFRQAHAIPKNAFVAGYVGRLAPEKNLAFLAKAIRAFAARCERGHFLVVGSGVSEGALRKTFADEGLVERLHLAGSLDGQALADAYHAMDVFVFASYTETQGMVLTEAMAAGKPVVALDAPGVREVARDTYNGRLLKTQSAADFAAAIADLEKDPASRKHAMSQAARQTAEEFSMDRSAARLVEVYERALRRQPDRATDTSLWHHAVERIRAEWELMRNVAEAAADTFTQ